MATYIVLVNWTDSGLKNVKEFPARLDAAKKLLSGMGGKFEQFYMTMGDADMVAICDIPDDDTAARFALRLSMQGSVRTRTMKAFGEDAYRHIVESLG